MRSITFVQAFQYWLKLTALLVPAIVLVGVWLDDGRPGPAVTDAAWSLPLGEGGGQGLYLTWSLIIATFLGTMGLPHVVVRYYRSEEHTSELQSLMRISYAVFCLKKKN